jgi:hypothetical protein
MGFHVDKRLKLDKPLDTINLSTEPRPINVANTAPKKTTRSNKITIETAKTGKVTAVVAVMSISSKIRCKSWNANLRNEKPSCQKAESANFPETNSCELSNLSQKTRKGRVPKKLASKSKKLELNSTNLELKSRRHSQIAPKCLI